MSADELLFRRSQGQRRVAPEDLKVERRCAGDLRFADLGQSDSERNGTLHEARAAAGIDRTGCRHARGQGDAAHAANGKDGFENCAALDCAAQDRHRIDRCGRERLLVSPFVLDVKIDIDSEHRDPDLAVDLVRVRSAQAQVEPEPGNDVAIDQKRQ